MEVIARNGEAVHLRAGHLDALRILGGIDVAGDSQAGLSVCPEMIFRLRKLFGNKGANFDCLTGRKTSLFSNFFGDLDYNNSWL